MNQIIYISVDLNLFNFSKDFPANLLQVLTDSSADIIQFIWF